MTGRLSHWFGLLTLLAVVISIFAIPSFDIPGWQAATLAVVVVIVGLTVSTVLLLNGALPSAYGRRVR